MTVAATVAATISATFSPRTIFTALQAAVQGLGVINFPATEKRH